MRARSPTPASHTPARPSPGKRRDVVWLNGRILPAGRARVSVQDRGLLYADAVFETVRLYSGAIFSWRAHERRLTASMRRFRFPRLPFSLRDAVEDLVSASGLSDAAIRITVTRGVGEGLLPPRHLEPTVLVTARGIPPDLARERKRGVAVVSLPFGPATTSLTAGHKTTAYLPAVVGRIRAQARSAYEGIYTGPDDEVSEGTTSNVFAVQAGRLLTPPLSSGCLPGVTRTLVLRIARSAGVPVREGGLRVRDLTRAEEVFLTGSVAEILPVVRLDGRRIGAGVPGPLTRRIADLYAQRLTRWRRGLRARR
jgi:branched-subunit amino acid aminotransferase/4-amino-4-deoxychorismate lyase